MLRRLSIKILSRAAASSRSVSTPWRECTPFAGAQQQWSATATRGLCEAAVVAPRDVGEKKKPDWAPGVPAPGREQTLGEAFAAMQYHGRGTRKVKASVLHRILERVSSEDELKYAHLGLKLFKTQGIKINTKGASLFIKACCRAGSPQAAVDALDMDKAEKYGLEQWDVVGANRFNYLLSQLYRAGDTENFARAVDGAERRRQKLNDRSLVLISRFKEEMRAKKAAEEEEVRKKKEEEMRVQKKEEEEKEQARIKEEQRVKEEEEAEARRKEEEEAKAADVKQKEEEEGQMAKKQEEDKAKQDQEEKARLRCEEQANKDAGEPIAPQAGGEMAKGTGDAPAVKGEDEAKR